MTPSEVPGEVARIRNVAFVGPHHSGKTTLVEAILDHCGALTRRGSVGDGTATTDYEPECIGHAQSTCVGFAHAACGEVELNVIDCPGFVEFFEETRMAMLAADAAAIVIEPDPSKLPQIAALVEAIEERKLPHLFVINKMDRPGADYAQTLAALQSAYGMHVVPEQWPIGAADQFRGFVDLTEQKAYRHSGTRHEETAMPEELAAEVAKARTSLLEALGDFDDHLLEELLEGVEPPLAEVRQELCNDCSHDRIVPVVVAAGSTGAGVAALLEALERQFPSPQTDPRIDVDGRTIVPDPSAPLVAQVCKTIVHPQSGKLSVVRVFAGTLAADATLVNASRSGATSRPAGLFRLQGKKQGPLKAAGPGSIVAVARLEHAITGDTLTAGGNRARMPVPKLCEPVFAVAIKPRERLDEAKLSQMLARLMDEDPTLRLSRAEFTNELQLLGSGEVHVAVATERLARKYNVKVETHAPTIPYRETLTTATEIHSRYKHQTGGHGQFGDVWLRIEPRERGHGVTFEEKIVGGVVPRQFFSAVEKGVRETLMHGPLGGFPVVDVHVTLFDGSYHAVDSSEASFRTAAAMGIRDGVQKCAPVLLEPIVHVTATVPSPYASTVISQLTSKRGHVLSFNPAAEKKGFDVVEALVPQVELSRYITELRTASQGLGTYAWRHERFEVVPPKMAQAAVKEPAAT